MPPARRPQRRQSPSDTPDLGIGGLLKGLGDLVERLSTLPEQTDATQSGTFSVKGLGENMQGIYGVSIRSGIGGIPRVEHFGNMRATDDGPEVAEAREPLVDMFDEADALVIIVELPGVSEADIQVELHGDVLALATTGARRFAREVLLTSAVDAASLRQTYRNGILEVRLSKVSL